MNLIDSHCHLDLDQFDDDREQVLTDAKKAGLSFIVNPGIDLEHSKQAIHLADLNDEVYAAVGFHPNSSQLFSEQPQADDAVAQLAQLAEHPKVVAIGEIGLDYYWDKVEPTVQKSAFNRQLEVAAKVGLPVIIHSRESNSDVTEILSQWVKSPLFKNSPLADKPFAGVLHAFSGDLAMANAAYDWGFVLSLGGPVTFKNARELHKLVPQLRMDRLMLETDAPFLTPHPFRGQRNQPAHVSLVCQRLAELYSVPDQTIAAMTTELACQFFGIGLLRS